MVGWQDLLKEEARLEEERIKEVRSPENWNAAMPGRSLASSSLLSCKVHAAVAAASFEDLDTNNDGVISREATATSLITETLTIHYMYLYVVLYIDLPLTNGSFRSSDRLKDVDRTEMLSSSVHPTGIPRLRAEGEQATEGEQALLLRDNSSLNFILLL